MLKVYKLFLFHLIIFLRVCAQRKILPSCNHITAKCEKMYPDRTRQDDQIVDGERACSKYSGQHRLEKNTKYGHCNNASHRKDDSSFFKHHYNCKSTNIIWIESNAFIYAKCRGERNPSRMNQAHLKHCKNLNI